MLVSHAANFAAARDTETFSNEIIPFEQLEALLAQLPSDLGRIPQAFPINLDPPRHTKYRMPLQRAFAPKTIEALRQSIRELAAELIDDFADRGHCEFMSAVAEILPVKVFLRMLGLPLERYVEYRELVRDHLEQSDPADAMKNMQRVAAAMRPTIMARRDEPRDDILSLLWQVEIDGAPATIEDLENYGVLLFIAGLDTVMQGMGHGVRRLAWDLELQDRLRANPSLIPEATEEMLRRYTFTIPPRRVARDVTFQNVAMKRDDRAMLFLPGADLDANEFDAPEDYRLDREKAHIAFNAGPHRCLGSHLARVELQVLYQELLARVPQFRLDPARPPTFHGGHVIGVDTLHLIWKVA